jgi:hypothetical protein
MSLVPSPRHALRRIAGCVALACALAGGAAVAADAAKPARVIQDPHYGDGLFYFFQDRYFTSITGLMTSQHFARMPRHADEAEILRGGMLLSYGLHREAGEIFAQLIEKGAAPAVRDRAWFFLAKIRYQRGFLDEALDAIGRIGDKLPPALAEERALLHANVLMAKTDYPGAAEVLKAVAGTSDAAQYARYNLGVALVRSGDDAAGGALLDAIGRAPAANEELRSLRDKANVALGFSALQADKPELARGALERVRLQGVSSNKALLGFGWAAASLKQPKLALVPWIELAERESSDAAVLEARIAVPYAYAELGAFGQALERYTGAINTFEREGAALDQSIAAIRAGKLIEGLIERNPGQEMGWFWSIGELPQMPHPGHLNQVLAQHEFQEAFKNWRDLQFLNGNLQQWQENLAVFSDMLANRRLAYAERLPKVRAKASLVDIDAAQKRRDALFEELQRAEQNNDGEAFASTRERDFLDRLAGMRATMEKAPDDPDVEVARDRVRLVAGALTWQLAQQFSARLWEGKKALQATDNALAEARRRDAALSQAQIDEPLRFERLAARIAELTPRIQALLPRVGTLAAEQQNFVQELAVAELTRQKERLAVYATQARFAVAQLYDRATTLKVDRASRP